MINTQCVIPVSIGSVAYYIFHLDLQGLQLSTIQTHLSAISYVQKMEDVHDSNHSFMISKMISHFTKQRQVGMLDFR